MFAALTLWKKKVSHIEIMDDFKYLAALGSYGLLNIQISKIPGMATCLIFDLVKLYSFQPHLQLLAFV